MIISYHLFSPIGFISEERVTSGIKFVFDHVELLLYHCTCIDQDWSRLMYANQEQFESSKKLVVSQD